VSKPEEPVNDPFAEFAPSPTPTSNADAATTTIGGLVFGAAVGAGCAYFWSLDYWTAAGVGAAIGGFAGWMSAPPKA
jgi:hypothetical protein